MNVIVAASRQQAYNTAVIDWGWEPTPKGFKDKSGTEVHYIHSLHQL